MDKRTYGDAPGNSKALQDSVPSQYMFGFAKDPIATGLLSALRFGPLSVEHFAKSAGVTYGYANQRLKRHILEHRLATEVRVLKQEHEGGRPPVMLHPTRAGYVLVCDRVAARWDGFDPVAMIGEYSRSPKSIDWRGSRKHRITMVDAMIGVEKSALARNGAGLREIIPEYRKWNGLASPTSFRVDAAKSRRSDFVLIMQIDSMRWAVNVEVDLATETVCSGTQHGIERSIEGKAKSYWHYLASRRILQRLPVTDAAFQVAFVTTTERHARYMNSIINDCGLMKFGGMTPADVFYFSTIEAAEKDFFGPHWIRGAGETGPLVQGV